MPLTDLSLVTKSLLKLVETNLPFRFSGTPTFDTTAAPPDTDPAGNDPTISIHLFHVIEDAHRKNAPPMFGGGKVPVQQTPLGLSLFYVVTVASKAASDPGFDTLTQQKLLGFCAKTFHDFPVLTDQTTINGVTILDPGLVGNDNRIEIVFRPVSIDEVISFWATEEGHTPKLALFLEVRVIVLEPEKPDTVSGIVLSVGNFVFPNGVPALISTQSSVAFFAPGMNPATDEPRRILASPARAALFDSPLPAGFCPKLADNDLVIIFASGLSGARRTLSLRGRTGTVRVNMDDRTQNAAWQFDVKATRLAFRMQRSVVDVEGTTQTLLPGIYGARVSVLRTVDVPTFAESTGEVAFAVTPQIFRIQGAGTARTIEIVGSYLSSGVDIQLGVGSTVLTENAALGPNTFRVSSGSVLDVELASVPAAGVALPVQLIVNGTQAAPAWVQEPQP